MRASDDSTGHGAGGRLYFRLCGAVSRRFGPGPDKLIKAARAREDKLKESERALAVAEQELRAKAFSPDVERLLAEKRFKAAEGRLKRALEAQGQVELRKALVHLGVRVEPYEVSFFAGFAALLALLAGMFILITVLMFAGDGGVSMMAVPATFIAPVLTYYLVLNHPKALAKRAKVESLAVTPQAINYMVMSMRLSPSLDRAVEFAAENTDGPISCALRKVIWDVYMKKYNSIEEAFLAFAYDWGENEDFKRSLYAIRSSSLERSGEGLSRSLDKASEIVLSGTKRRIEEFVSTLSAPTTIMFSLGVLLPLIIGAMLPMLSLGSLNVEMGTDAREVEPQSSNPLMIVVLMDVVFPLAGALYAHRILGRRPGTSIPLEVRAAGAERSVTMAKAASTAAGLFLFSAGAVLLVAEGSPLGAFLVLWGAGIPIAVSFIAGTWRKRKVRNEVLRMEREFPDALFQLGSRIAEGMPVEHAFKMTAATMKGSLIAGLFDRISLYVQMTRTTLDDALFGSNGMLREMPSKTIKSTLKVVVELTKKDSFEAGQTIISISNYLRDLKKIEHEIRTQLKSSVDSMKATGMIFSPLVMGVTMALYFLLADVFGGMGGGMAQMMPSYMFILIIGAYLLSMVFVITYFCTGIEHGADVLERRYQTGTAVLVAMLVFTVASAVASTGLTA